MIRESKIAKFIIYFEYDKVMKNINILFELSVI